MVVYLYVDGQTYTSQKYNIYTYILLLVCPFALFPLYSSPPRKHFLIL